MRQLLFLFLFAASALFSQGQRYALIDTRYLLDKLPDYKSANKKIEEIAEAWQQEIDLMQADLDKMYRELEVERVMLTPELLKKREDEIYNKVYNAVQKLASEKMYDFVLDKSEGITIIFADPKLDKSDDVLKILGIKL